LGLKVSAALITILGVAGCAREEEPAPQATPEPAAAPPPAAAAPAAAAPIRDGADPVTHGRYLVETIAGCGICPAAADEVLRAQQVAARQIQAQGVRHRGLR
jgi:hypothetical protein